MNQTSSPRSVLSLYTGAGGLDLGMEAAGFDTRVAVEMDPDAAATLRCNRSWSVIESDVHADAASSTAILRAAELTPGEADLLIGGPPCQPFSKSGYWAGGDSRRLSDSRATTLEAYLRVLRDTQPRAFLLENVPGLAFRGKREGLDLLERTIEAINREAGTNYSFNYAVLNAAEHGVPQDRHRVFIVGARDGTRFEFPAPAYFAAGQDQGEPSRPADLSSSMLRPALTAWDAIGDLEDDDDPSLRVTGKWADLLPSIPEGPTISTTPIAGRVCPCSDGGGGIGVSCSSWPSVCPRGPSPQPLGRR
jgi:DNA (cytosine-5)-methyltransferase 1